MSGAPLSIIAGALEDRDCRPQRRGDHIAARCPSHDDHNPSLSVDYDRVAGKVLVNCHTGCSPDDVIAALGLTWADLFDKSDEDDRVRRPEIVAKYDYVDLGGKVLYQKVRYVPKDFRIRRPDGNGGWDWRIGDNTPRVLYRLDRVAAAIPAGRPILLVEGEKDADRLAGLGFVATCNVEGAAKEGQRPKWRNCYSEQLRGAYVTIIADNDEAGLAHAKAAAAALGDIAATVKLTRPKVDEPKADITDHLDAGYGIDDLIALDDDTITRRTVRVIELDEFLNADIPEYDWLVPGLLERADRFIITADEGAGKSTLERQLAVQFASGIHPFDDDADFPPLCVVLLDLENSTRQVHREIRPLRVAAGDRYAGALYLHIRPQGLDLMISQDRIWLDDLLGDVHPDLLVTGPTYRLANADPTEEKTAKMVTACLDGLRVKHGCAVILEAHIPYASNGTRKRPERPYGASLWSRWPEFGLYLDKTNGELRHWRGPRDERDWPSMLKRGGHWPFTVDQTAREVVWARIVDHVRNTGERPSFRSLATLLGVSYSKIQRTIKDHQKLWDEMG